MNGVEILDKDYAEVQLLKWSSAVESLFPQGIPFQSEWTDMGEIREVLDHIFSSGAFNHTFLNSGGVEYNSIGDNYEEGTLTLVTSGSRHIIKPKRVTFYNLADNNPNWSFFYIELDPIEPLGTYEESRTSEEVVCLSQGQFISREQWERDTDNGRKFPASATVVKREWKGNYVMFSKGSLYNRSGDTYDGKHSKMGRDAFKNYIVRGLSK
ncbi:hypothetical protein BACPU_26040 [Bacillus pumilus]|nr:hypothetical protein BACPU_26040 [Bacillus pumilus]